MRSWKPTPVFLPAESHGQKSRGLQYIKSQRVRHDLSDLAHTKFLTKKFECMIYQGQNLRSDIPEFKVMIYQGQNIRSDSYYK